MQKQIFEEIKQLNEFGQEYRMARALSKVLHYADFGNFEKVIQKAKITCEHSWQTVADHFGDTTEMVQIGSGSQRTFPSYLLSRYACYLIAMEADGSKAEVALAKTYFAIQTRRQEMSDQFLADKSRLVLRDEMTFRNKRLFKTAKKSWVQDYANFYDYGYLGLYGMRKNDITQKKGLKQKDNLLDYMDGEELGANVFRATQAEAKIRREGFVGQQQASKIHYEVGKKVRKTIKEIWGTMPEELPLTDDIKLIKKRIQRRNSALPL